MISSFLIHCHKCRRSYPHVKRPVIPQWSVALCQHQATRHGPGYLGEERRQHSATPHWNVMMDTETTTRTTTLVERDGHCHASLYCHWNVIDTETTTTLVERRRALPCMPLLLIEMPWWTLRQQQQQQQQHWSRGDGHCHASHYCSLKCCGGHWDSKNNTGGEEMGTTKHYPNTYGNAVMDTPTSTTLLERRVISPNIPPVPIEMMW